MAILHVRNIPAPLYERARRIAQSRGKSLSAVVIELLEDLDRREAARRKHAKIMREIKANMEARRRDWPANMPSAADVIREGREERERELLGGLS